MDCCQCVEPLCVCKNYRKVLYSVCSHFQPVQWTTTETQLPLEFTVLAMAKLIAICAGGLETLVIEDIKRAAPSNVQVEQVSSGKNVSNCIQVAGLSVNRGESGCGKILVSNVLDFEFLDKVRSVQTWLVFMVESASVPSSASKGIGYIQNLVSQSVDLSGALATWERCLVASSVQKYQDLITKARPPKFCVRCIRDGEHEYSSLDVSRKVGESVLANTNWSVDLCNMDFEIIVLILSETMLIGINIPTLSPPFLKSKLPGEVRPPVVPSGLTSGLRPSTAYLLVALAHPEPGDILVDAMCGCGATFIEAAYSHGCIAIGGDVDQELLPTLRQSLQQTAQMSFNKAVAEVSDNFHSGFVQCSAIIHDLHNQFCLSFQLIAKYCCGGVCCLHSWRGGAPRSCQCVTDQWTS